MINEIRLRILKELLDEPSGNKLADLCYQIYIQSPPAGLEYRLCCFVVHHLATSMSKEYDAPASAVTHRAMALVTLAQLLWIDLELPSGVELEINRLRLCLPTDFLEWLRKTLTYGAPYASVKTFSELWMV